MSAPSAARRSLIEVIAPERLGRPFRWLLASSWTSNLGDGISLAAGPLLVASQTRDPFTVARAVATASAYTSGRVICGVSAGWLKEEYDAAGVDFKSRGRRLDEILAICRRLWVGETVSHDGEFFRFDAVLLRPLPPGPVPIWVGGKSAPALRRAAANDGWLGLPATVDDTIAIVQHLQALRTEMGLPASGFSPVISLIEPLLESSEERLAGHGINDMVVIPWMPTPWEMESYVAEGSDISQLSVKKDAISRFADRVIHRRH